MNSFIRHMYILLHSAAVWIVAAVVLHSCADNTEVLPEYEPECYGVGLYLTVSDISSSRTTPSGSYDDGRGTAYENYINIFDEDFQVMLFESETPHRLITVLENLQLTEIEADGATSKTYFLAGTLSNSIENGSFKFVMLANWRGCGGVYPEVTPGETVIDDVMEASVYNYAEGFTLSRDHGIPMYGIKDCEGVEFRPDMVVDLGTLHLLRAMAKIELQTVDGSFLISEAHLTRVNSSGLAVPRGIYSQDAYVRGSYAEDYLDGIHLPEETGILTEIPFRKLADDRYVLYVPEYDNTSESAEKARIHLSFENSDGKDDYVDFKFYDEEAASKAGAALDDCFDIRRNYYYIYTLNKHVNELIVDVQPYASVVLEPDFGL